MKRILKNRRGVTLLEGLIALGLLALVAAGTFGVLLSVAHKSSKPDIREEMVLAVEKANDQLHAYSQNMNNTLTENTTKLCAEDTQTKPLATGEHNIICLLPVICDRDQSSFTYTVSNAMEMKFYDEENDDKAQNNFLAKDNYINAAGLQNIKSLHRQITFNITCNGFVL